jgi:hypothetical protein
MSDYEGSASIIVGYQRTCRTRFRRRAHLCQGGVRPSRSHPAPEWCAAMKAISGSCRLYDQPALAPPCIAWRTGQGWARDRTHGAPSQPNRPLADSCARWAPMGLGGCPSGLFAPKPSAIAGARVIVTPMVVAAQEAEGPSPLILFCKVLGATIIVIG